MHQGYLCQGLKQRRALVSDMEFNRDIGEFPRIHISAIFGAHPTSASN